MSSQTTLNFLKYEALIRISFHRLSKPHTGCRECWLRHDIPVAFRRFCVALSSLHLWVSWHSLFFFQLSSVGGWLRKRSQFWYRKSELSRFDTVTTSGVRQDPWGANKSTKKKQRWISRQMKKIHYRCQSSIPSTFVCFGYPTLLVWSCDFASSNDGKYRSSRRRSTPRHTVVTMADKRHVLSVAFSAHRHDLYIIDSPSLNVGASATQNTCGGRHWNFHFLSNQKAAVMKSLYVFVYV